MTVGRGRLASKILLLVSGSRPRRLEQPSRWEMRENAPSENPGIPVVLRALRDLKPAPNIPAEAENDSERLAEILFDRFESFTPGRFLALLGHLRLETLVKKAYGVLERQYLFLDAQEVAQQALVKLLTDLLAERRLLPYGSWEDRAVEETAELLREEPGLALLRFPGARSLERAALADLTRFYNRLGRRYRRLVWMICIQGKSVLEVSRETGIPYERLEWIWTQVDRDAEQLIGRVLDGQVRYADASEGAESFPCDEEGQGGNGDGGDRDEEAEHGA